MAVKKPQKERGKIIARYVGETYFDVHHVPTYKGEGKARRMETSTIALYHGKHLLEKGFKNVEDATAFAVAIFPSYNKKRKTFKKPD